MQAISYEIEKTDRVFEAEIKGRSMPCAEVHIKRAVLLGAHREINRFYAELCGEFCSYGEKSLAAEFAERFSAAATARERCALKIPVLSVNISVKSTAPLEIITEYALFYGARAAKRGKIPTKWDARRGIMVKESANHRRSTAKA